MKNLSNVEIALLQIIYIEKKISGYTINKLIIERGYRNWAGIGTTSIYAGLKKLETKKLIASQNIIKKTGKGPQPNIYSISQSGKKILLQEIKTIIESCRDSGRFALALAAYPILKNQDIVESLKKRTSFLLSVKSNIEKTYEHQGGNKLPLNVKALFKHSLGLVSENLRFTDYLLSEL
ncbi:MAG TPA: PadR family transcriptional regulator [bacterium]|nr:PadR family transcriptional regulator [bacterium]